VPRLALLAAAALAAAAPGAEVKARRDGVAVTASCSADAQPLARLARGDVLKLRVVIAGVSRACYAVSAEAGGRTVQGYVRKEDVEGLESLEQARREAAGPAWETIGPGPVSNGAAGGGPELAGVLREAVEKLRAGQPAEAEAILSAPEVARRDRDVAVLRAQALLQLTRSRDALNLLEQALRSRPDDPVLLGLAGMASLQQDLLHQAQDYLQRSLDLDYNPRFERFLRRARRELNGGSNRARAYGPRFVLRYPGERLTQAEAREFITAAERESVRISQWLGCPGRDRLTVVMHTRDSYQNSTGAAHWSGGAFDGRIHVVLPPEGGARGALPTFAHEFTHACLAAEGRWPAWLHEGLAQWAAGKRLSGARAAQLRQLAAQGGLPPLSRLSGSWTAREQQEAAAAYLASLAAVEIFFEEFSALGVRNLIRNPRHLDRVQKRLESELRSRYR